MHPALKVEPVVPGGMEGDIGGLDVLSNGWLALAVIDEDDGRVVIVEGGPGEAPAVRTFAAGLDRPLGLRVVDDEIFVLQKQSLLHLIDRDGNGVADEYRTVSEAWPLSTDYLELSSGLDYREGAFYAGLSVPIDREGAILIETVPGRGRLVGIGFDGQVTTVYDALHVPGGLRIDASGAVVVADHRNRWFSDSRLLVVQTEGDAIQSGAGAPRAASIWIPVEAGPVAPTQPVLAPAGAYAGQWIFGDANDNRLFRCALDTVGGGVQGAVFAFSGGLPFVAGRFAHVTGDTLIAGRLRLTRPDTTGDGTALNLAHLSFSGAAPFEMHTIRAVPDGFELVFTRPPDPVAAGEVDRYRLYTKPNSMQTGRRVRAVESMNRMEVTGVQVLADSVTVRIEVADLEPERVVYFNLDPALESAAGDRLWTNEAWYSLNDVPGRAVGHVMGDSR